MTTAPPAASPLAGITVLALEQAIAAPLCTRHLADLGARVIKVEQPGAGDASRHYDGVVRGLAAHFVWLNHGKQSAALDLTEPSDRNVQRPRVAAAHQRSAGAAGPGRGPALRAQRELGPAPGPAG